MLKFLECWLPRGTRPAPLAHLTADTWPAVIYAIGDVHGCLTELRTLESSIIADAAGISGEKWLVMLGDYVDRGPQSAGVLDKLSAPAPAGFRRICLAGNHEAMMLSVLQTPAKAEGWLQFGGRETLHSYGIDIRQFERGNARARVTLLQSHIPTEHYDFLKDLPALVSMPGLVLVHAGIRREISIEKQSEADLMWIREPFLSDISPGPLVVHGHTPGPIPVVTTNRIGVDTGAYATGVLTAVRLEQGAEPRFLTSNPPAS